MRHESVAERRSEPEQAQGTRSAATAPALGTPAGVLSLQRAAGNRAVGAALRSAATATLARCAGPCTCGGKCGGEEELDPDAARRA